MHIGMALQVIALTMLMVPDAWLSVVYVMIAQALSGIAKDLNKMSAKASVKTLLPQTDHHARLFKWIAVLTGSKNALKGIGFFLGAVLLEAFEFRGALAVLAVSLLLVLLLSIALLPKGLGKTKSKVRFSQVFSKTAAINWLSAARFFLFGARDIWFVVALPVYLYSVFDWSFMQVGSFIALWIIGYGIVQALAPRLLRAQSRKRRQHRHEPDGGTATGWAFVLAIIPIAIAIGLNPFASAELNAKIILISGLVLFGIVFAINSAVHSFLIVHWSEQDKVSQNVGFYYMANAAGRLTGTVLSGWVYQTQGLEGCLLISTVFIITAALLSFFLPKHK